MKARHLRLIALVPVSMLGACAADVAPSGPGVSVNVAPLTLPGVLDVEYAVAVFNAPPVAASIFDAGGVVVGNVADKVWGEASVTSGQFGNGAGGDITYIGPCDAQETSNWVALALKNVNVGTGNGSYQDGTSVFPGSFNLLDDQNTAPGNDGDADYVNPSPWNDPLVLEFPCVENQDTLVTFNLTIMRDADQGFFDIAVNFEDIFCSMKLDNCDVNGERIELLFGDQSGDEVTDGAGRDETAVFAMACTAGLGDAIDTELLLGQVSIRCGATTFQLPLTGLDEGNHDVPVDFDGNAIDARVQYGLYYGDEELDCDDPSTTADEGSCNKAYFNIAINLEDLPDGCFISLEATAQDANLPVIDKAGQISTAGTTYPFVQVSGAALSREGCFSHQPGDGGPLDVAYGTSKDLLSARTAAVMCNRSNNEKFPQAFDNRELLIARYATYADAKQIPAYQDLLKAENAFEMQTSPCGTAEAKRTLERWQIWNVTEAWGVSTMYISGLSIPILDGVASEDRRTFLGQINAEIGYVDLQGQARTLAKNKLDVLDAEITKSGFYRLANDALNIIGPEYKLFVHYSFGEGLASRVQVANDGFFLGLVLGKVQP